MGGGGQLTTSATTGNYAETDRYLLLQMYVCDLPICYYYMASIY